jgi:hypothetical protein
MEDATAQARVFVFVGGRPPPRGSSPAAAAPRRWHLANESVAWRSTTRTYTASTSFSTSIPLFFFFLFSCMERDLL